MVTPRSSRMMNGSPGPQRGRGTRYRPRGRWWRRGWCDARRPCPTCARGAAAGTPVVIGGARHGQHVQRHRGARRRSDHLYEVSPVHPHGGNVAAEPSPPRSVASGASAGGVVVDAHAAHHRAGHPADELVPSTVTLSGGRCRNIGRFGRGGLDPSVVRCRRSSVPVVGTEREKGASSGRSTGAGAPRPRPSGGGVRRARRPGGLGVRRAVRRGRHRAQRAGGRERGGAAALPRRGAGHPVPSARPLAAGPPRPEPLAAGIVVVALVVALDGVRVDGGRRASCGRPTS